MILTIKSKYRIVACMLIIILAILPLNNKISLASTVKTTQYKMKEDIVTYKDDTGKVRGVIYFQYPELVESSYSIKKINSVLKKDCNAYMKSETAQSLKEYTQIGIDNNEFVDTDTQYYYKTTCKVTYNNKTIISMHMKMCWYAGGVYNQSDYGYTFNTNNGKRLGVKDVISGDSSSVKKKILAAGKEYLTNKDGFDQNAYHILNDYKLDDFKFYLSKDKVYICFESYELQRGTGWDIFYLKHKF